MDNFWRIINSNERITPYEYIREQCNALSDATRRKVIAKINEYDGAYKSKKTLPFLEEEQERFNWWSGVTKTYEYDVQSDLGDNNTKFVYEFYVSSVATPKYKYRIMFLAYDVSLYPVEISLEKSIADEINNGTCEFTLSNEKDFLQFLKSVLGSKKVTEVISNLMKISKLAKRNLSEIH